MCGRFSEARSKACREKSAETKVAHYELICEGSNFKNTCSQKGRAVLESYAGGQTFLWMSESEDTRGNLERHMLEYVLSPSNLNAAWKQAVRNKGVGGIDEMEVSELKDYLKGHKEQSLASVLRGDCQPQAVKRVEIPRNDVGKRKLGIPVVFFFQHLRRLTPQNIYIHQGFYFAY